MKLHIYDHQSILNVCIIVEYKVLRLKMVYLYAWHLEINKGRLR